jgi:hypothetical protein
MTTKQCSQLTNINRLLILFLTVVGLAMDGPQAADLFFSAASCIWLWMPVWMRMEVQLFKPADVAEVDVDCGCPDV